jgi:hypothetical protein
LASLQGPQTLTLSVTEEPGQEASEEVASGQEYPALAPEDAAALTAELNQAFAAALAPAAGQQPELFGLRIEASLLPFLKAVNKKVVAHVACSPALLSC